MSRPTVISEVRLALPEQLADLDVCARFVEYARDFDHDGGAWLEVWIDDRDEDPALMEAVGDIVEAREVLDGVSPDEVI